MMKAVSTTILNILRFTWFKKLYIYKTLFNNWVSLSFVCPPTHRMFVPHIVMEDMVIESGVKKKLRAKKEEPKK